MNFDFIIKLATVFIGAVGAAKLVFDLSIGKQSRMRDEYEFAKKFIDTTKNEKDLHPYLKEKGYQAIAGDSKLKAAEVEYILSLQQPEQALKNYVSGLKYLEHLPKSGNLEIGFKTKYKKKWSRKWRQLLYLVIYMLLCFMAFAPLLAPNTWFKSPSQMLISFTVTFILFFPHAYSALKAGQRISRAERLVKEQNKHTQKIIIGSRTRRAD